MNKIVQLSNHKYDKLFELASLNEKDIQDRAFELYKKEGYLGVKVQLSIINSNKDYKIDTYNFIEQGFKLSYSDNKELSDNIDTRVKELLTRRFGEHLSLISNVEKEAEKLRLTRNKFLIFTVLGWLTAITLVLLG